MKCKTFIASFIVCYLLMSVPTMLGIGTVIDWVPEATFAQKLKAYLFEGAAIKIVFSASTSIVISMLLTNRHAEI